MTCRGRRVRTQACQLLAIDDVLEGARRIEQHRWQLSALLAAARWRSMAISGAMPDPPATSSSGLPSPRGPDEIAADRPAQLEAGRRLRSSLVEVGRDLAVVDALDGEHHRAVLGATRSSSCAAPGIRPRRSAGRRRAARPVARPAGTSARCWRAASRSLDHLGGQPAARGAAATRQSPAVPLLSPRIAVVVVAVAAPRSRARRSSRSAARAPTWRSSRSTDAAPAAAPGRRARRSSGSPS